MYFGRCLLFLGSSCWFSFLALFLGSPLDPVAVMRSISLLSCHSERKRRIFPPASIRFPSILAGGFSFSWFFFLVPLFCSRSWFFPCFILSSHPRHTLFRRFPCVALSLPPVPTFPLPPNPLSLSDILHPHAPHLRHALPVIS